jgi:hypothetical protein
MTALAVRCVESDKHSPLAAKLPDFPFEVPAPHLVIIAHICAICQEIRRDGQSENLVRFDRGLYGSLALARFAVLESA